MSAGRRRVARPTAYIVDTNFYIRAFRDPEFGEEFRSWHGTMIGRLAMSVVVLHELLSGAVDERRRDVLERAYALEFRKRGRLLVPSEPSWIRAAQADRKIRVRGGYHVELNRRSFGNDLLIALSCREIGATLITLNSVDFDLIETVTGVRHRDTLPEAE